MNGIAIKKVKQKHFEKMVPFSFRKIGGYVLIVNEYGNYLFLEEPDFKDLVENGLPYGNRRLMEDFQKHNMIFTKETRAGVVDKALKRFRDPAHITNLHIIIATLRCNLKCLYCQANSVPGSTHGTDMSIETAEKVVDTIFQAPSEVLSIEFQGGEPLLNWEVVKHIIKYAKEVNKVKNRSISFNIVSNHTLIDDEKLDFLVENEVVMCMSLDGPDYVHNKNRGDNHALVVKNYRKVFDRYVNEGLERLPALIGTVTKHSLPYAREIVDEYRSLGSNSIFVRPPTTLGVAQKNWEKIGITTDEFLEFYAEIIDYVLEINHGGTYFTETFAIYILSKAIAGHEPGYVDLKSPCGAALGQLAYNYNGDVYTCDEARMLGHLGDDTFKIGTCGESTYTDLIMHKATKAVCLASTIESTPGCSMCVYKPYCGICPVQNYHESGELSPNVFTTRRHKINEGIMDILFERLLIPENSAVFLKWIEDYVGKRVQDDNAVIPDNGSERDNVPEEKECECEKSN